MEDYVINEFVHVDYYDQGPNFTKVFYEPLDHDPTMIKAISLCGCIKWDEKTIRFCHGNRHNLLADNYEDLIWGGYHEGVIMWMWFNNPGEHYITASYTLGEKRTKVNWLKEGF